MDDGSLAGVLKKLGDRIADLQKRVHDLEHEAAWSRLTPSDPMSCQCVPSVFLSAGCCVNGPTVRECRPSLPGARWVDVNVGLPAEGEVVLVQLHGGQLVRAECREGVWREPCVADPMRGQIRCWLVIPPPP